MMTSTIQIPLFFSKSFDQDLRNIKSTENGIDDVDIITVEQYYDDDPPLINLPFDTRLGICAILAVSFVIGSFFKGITYSFVFTGDSKHGWSQNPINALILTSTIIHHITHGWLVIWYIHMLMIETPIGDFIHPNWCHITQYVGTYGIAYLSVGSLGIAIVRVLYIRHQNLLKYVMGESTLLIIVWSLSIIICGMIVVMFNMESSSQRFQVNMCKGISATNLQILIDYQLHQDHELLPTTYLQMTSLVILLAFQTSEFIIYVWFFNYRYKNDNGNVRRLLTEDVIRSRNMKNIGTFVGQFYGFLMEYSFLFLVFLLTCFSDVKNIHTKAMLNMVKFIDFGLISAVEVLTSPNLRDFVLWKLNGN